MVNKEQYYLQFHLNNLTNFEHGEIMILTTLRNYLMLVRQINGDKNTNFGWKHVTHRFCTGELVEKYNQLLSRESRMSWEVLFESCIEPDRARHDVQKYVRGHFADIENPSYDCPDALDLLKKYTNKAIKTHCDALEALGDSRARGTSRHSRAKKAEEASLLFDKRDAYIGYAVHFLQDSLDPMHVVFRPFEKNDPEKDFHNAFEYLASFIQERVLSSRKRNSLLPQQAEGVSFFGEALPKSMKLNRFIHKQLKQRNSYKIFIPDKESELCAKISLENTFSTTAEYFKYLTEKLNDCEENLRTFKPRSKRRPGRKQVDYLA